MKNDLQNVTQYTLNDLRPDTSYDVRIISQRDGITSLPTKIITRTRISGRVFTMIICIVFSKEICDH